MVVSQNPSKLLNTKSVRTSKRIADKLKLCSVLSTKLDGLGLFLVRLLRKLHSQVFAPHIAE